MGSQMIHFCSGAHLIRACGVILMWRSHSRTTALSPSLFLSFRAFPLNSVGLKNNHGFRKQTIFFLNAQINLFGVNNLPEYASSISSD